MKLGEIFGDALKYPISNPQSLIIVGVIFLIAKGLPPFMTPICMTIPLLTAPMPTPLGQSRII